MKHPKSTLLLFCGVGLLLLNSADLTAQVGEPNAMRVVAETGVVTLGPNQVLRVTAVKGTRGPRNVVVRFGTIAYAEGVCNGPVCTHAVASRATSGLLTLAGGAAASIEIPNTAPGDRGTVSSSNQDLKVVVSSNTEGDVPSLELKVLVQIVDAATGQVAVAYAPPPDVPGTPDPPDPDPCP